MNRGRATDLAISYTLLLLIGGGFALWLWDSFDSLAQDEPVDWLRPGALVLLGGCVLVIWVALHMRVSRAPTFAFSRVTHLVQTRVGLVARLTSLPNVLRVVALGLIAVGLARPQSYREQVRELDTIDIMFVLDLSRSMEESDLFRNRLDAGQRMIRNFIQKRRDDRIGLVVFAQEAMTQCPLTLDHKSLDYLVADLAIGDVPERGTAIGDALALALASLKRSDSQSKLVILLSDGDSNWTTRFSPAEAKELAKTMNVKVFTILMGRAGRGMGLFGGSHSTNPELLEEIANETGGRHFNAGDDEALSRSFRQVRESLEKTTRRVTERVSDDELFPKFVVPALVLLLLELLLSLTRWRRFP